MKYLVLVTLWIFISTAQAQEHLHPEHSILSDRPLSVDYEAFLSRLFHRSEGRDVMLKVVILPSFQHESVLFIEEREGSYLLTHLAAEQRYGPGYNDASVVSPAEKCSINIDAQKAEDLEKIWHRELKNTRHPEKFRGGMDGTRYHFSTPIKPIRREYSLPRMSGQIWSPDPDSRMGNLVDLVWTLADYCENQTNSEDLEGAIEKLLD